MKGDRDRGNETERKGQTEAEEQATVCAICRGMLFDKPMGEAAEKIALDQVYDSVSYHRTRCG